MMRLLLAVLLMLPSTARAVRMSQSLGDGSITTAKLGDGAVTTSKLHAEALSPITLDQANTRVGINTSGPTRPLDLNHATAPEIGFRVADTAAGSIFVDGTDMYLDPGAQGLGVNLGRSNGAVAQLGGGYCPVGDRCTGYIFRSKSTIFNDSCYNLHRTKKDS